MAGFARGAGSCFPSGVSASTAAAHIRNGGAGAAAAASAVAKAATESCPWRAFLPSSPFPYFSAGKFFARCTKHPATLIANINKISPIFTLRNFPPTPCTASRSLIQSMINGRTADRSPLSPSRPRRSDGRRTEGRGERARGRGRRRPFSLSVFDGASDRPMPSLPLSLSPSSV